MDNFTWRTPEGEYSSFYMNCLKQPHLLIAGMTGSGKSVVLNGIIYNALYNAPCETAFILCDPKMVELSRYEKLPHVLRYADTLQGIADALKYGHSLMMNRFQRMKAAGIVETVERDIYIIVDEFADLITRNPGEPKEIARLKASCDSFVESIGKLGRAAHVHLILATQSPDRKTIKPHIVQNMTAKIALKCESDIESRQILGVKGAETLPRYGEAYYKDPEHTPPQHVINIPYFTAEALTERVRWWTEQGTRYDALLQSTKCQRPQQKKGFFSRLFCA